jgi:hypothetical protein
MNKGRMRGFLVFCLALAILLVLPVSAKAAVIDYPYFFDISALKLNGAAHHTSNLIRLTSGTTDQGGSVFTKEKIRLSSDRSFSTYFTIRMSGEADGMCFVMQQSANTALGYHGGGLGIINIPQPIVAVEFDHHNEGEPYAHCHVGIDINPYVAYWPTQASSVAVASCPWNLENYAVYHVWVDYDGTYMDVRMSTSNNKSSSIHLLHHKVDLKSLLNQEVYVGFTGATGAESGVHEVLSWQFSGGNSEPVISFTSLPAGSKIHKAEQTLVFKVKATDPDTEDQNLITEFYLDTGSGYKKVNSFTANGANVNNGQFTAKNGTEYTITMNKTALIPTNVNSFKLKAVTKDPSGAQTEIITNLTHYNSAPAVTFVNLAAGQDIRKSIDTFEFALKATDSDAVDQNLTTELYIAVNNNYQKVNVFTVNGVLNSTGKFTAVNGTQYNIIINKADYLALDVDNFKLKAVVTDPFGSSGNKEINLVHFQDILARWSMDSVQNEMALDSSGNNNHGTIENAVLTTGIITNALEFDGANAFVSVPKPSLNNLTNWSIEAWIKPDGEGYIYSEGNPAVTFFMEVKNDNSLNIGTWHYPHSSQIIKSVFLNCFIKRCNSPLAFASLKRLTKAAVR